MMMLNDGVRRSSQKKKKNLEIPNSVGRVQVTMTELLLTSQEQRHPMFDVQQKQAGHLIHVVLLFVSYCCPMYWAVIEARRNPHLRYHQSVHFLQATKTIIVSYRRRYDEAYSDVNSRRRSPSPSSFWTRTCQGLVSWDKLSSFETSHY